LSISDEILMAYADGELDAARLAEVESAVAADPELSRRVERHLALRRNLQATFDETLSEPVPERLLAAVHAPSRNPSIGEHGPNTVVQLARKREATRGEARPRHWTRLEWGAIAASLAVGALVALFAVRSRDADRLEVLDGALIAQGDLQRALDEQLASNPPADPRVRVGVSFSGEYCRGFIVNERNALGGLACRGDAGWRVDVLAKTEVSPVPQGGYVPAGAALPAAVLEAMDASMKGEPLDAAQELAARSQGWR
jgi:hypothetical protein